MATQTGSIDLKGMTSAYSDQQQYFWVESSSSATWGGGAHITNIAESAFKTAAGTWGTDPTAGGYNLLMNTDTANATGSLQLRNGSLPIMNLDNDSLDFNTIDITSGTYTTVASFGGDGSRIGKAGNPQFEISSTGMEGLNENRMPYFRVRYDGAAKEDILWNSTGLEISGTNGTINLPKDITTDAVLRGRVVVSLSSQSEIITNVQVTPGFTEGEVDNGNKTRAYLYFEISNWDVTQSHSFRGEASLTVATGVSPRSITTTITYNPSNRNIVFNTTSSGPYGNIGYSKIDIGGVYDTYMPLFVMGTAYGEVGGYSTVIGEQLQASSENQVVIGKFNNNQSTNAFEIGNGTDGSRSNAFTVDWDGNVEAAGSITDGEGYSIPHAVSGTTSITTTTGTLNSHVIGRYGRVRMLRLAVQKSSATAAGANLYQGKINTVADRPLFSSAYGSGYYGSAGVLVVIAQDGTITVRVVGAQIGANVSTWCGVTYIAQGD